MGVAISAITNTAELMAMHAFARHQQSINQATIRLATGLRINRAADDPSGLIASENLGAEIAAIQKRIVALERDEFRLSAREGVLSVVSDLAVELQGLVTQGANSAGLDDTEKEALQEELDGVIEAIEFVHQTSTFEGQRIFEQWTIESLGSVYAPPPEGEEGEEPASPVPPTRYTLADLKSGGALSITDGDLELAQELVDSVHGGVSTTRAGIGALQKDFYASQIDSLHRELEALTAARSSIRDADFAVEVSNLVRAQVLQQASLQAILIARDNGSRALGLLGALRQ